jgi:hypothetical protein
MCLQRERMSKRIDKSWLVFASIKNGEHDRCVDIFLRPDHTFGFEEFRRDVEDAGEWTPVQYCSGLEFETAEAVYNAAEQAVPWIVEILTRSPHLKKWPNRISK